ncbi:MAG: hypothetical protein CMC70_01740 [Flavobacteriaceae bacterium]|nr:hypothetical protein [Flavobacteriaceae bacterium]
MRSIFLLVSCCLLSSILSAQTIVAEIIGQNRNMEKAYNTGNVTAIATYYTNNAAIVGPRTEVTGNPAIVEYWKGLEGRHVKWTLENTEITPYEDVVIQRGISHLQFYQDEKIVQSDVRFTLVWIKEDNQWKINIDHYSPL